MPNLVADHVGICILFYALLMFLFAAAGATSEFGSRPSKPVKAKRGATVTVVKMGDIGPLNKVVQPCKLDDGPFTGQSVPVIMSNGIISLSIPELKTQFEAATGAKLNIMQIRAADEGHPSREPGW